MMTNKTFTTGEDFFHRLNFLFNLMVAIPLLPFAILYLFNLKNKIPDMGLAESVKMVLTIVIALASSLITLKAIKGYRNHKNQTDSTASLREKLIRLHQGLMNKFLLLEGASILTTMGLWLTHHKIHIVVFVVILVVFSLKRPTVRMLVEDLKLPGNEADVLRKKEQIE